MNKKQKQEWQEELESLCWARFCETGAIGDYMLYHSIKKDNNEPKRKNNNRNSSTNNKLQR